MKVRFSHLSLSERHKIERWRQMKLSPDEIAAYGGHATKAMIAKYAGEAWQEMRARTAREKRR